MKERNNSTIILLCTFANVGYSSCVLSSLPCFCPFPGPSLGHTNSILCCSGKKTCQAGSVCRVNNDNNSHVISSSHLCVAEARTRVSIIKCSSPARNAFVSSAKCNKTRSPLAITMVVYSVLSYLEASSRDYLVASDERGRLQCDIVFESDSGLPRLARGRFYANYHY